MLFSSQLRPAVYALWKRYWEEANVLGGRCPTGDDCPDISVFQRGITKDQTPGLPYHSPDRKNPNFPDKRLQAINQTNAHSLIQILREHHVWKMKYSMNKVLPLHVASAPLLAVFRQLETFLFSRSYQDTIIWLVCYYHHSSLLSGHLCSLQ